MFIFSPLPLIFASLLLTPITDAKSVVKRDSKAQLFSQIVENDLPDGTPQTPLTIDNNEDGIFPVISAVASRTAMLTDEESAMTLVRLDDEHPSYLTLRFISVSGSFKNPVKAEITFAKEGKSASYIYSFDGFDQYCKKAGIARSEFDCSPSHHLSETIGPIRLPKPSSLPDWAQSGTLSGHFKVSAGATAGSHDVLILETSFYAVVLE